MKITHSKFNCKLIQHSLFFSYVCTVFFAPSKYSFAINKIGIFYLGAHAFAHLWILSFYRKWHTNSSEQQKTTTATITLNHFRERKKIETIEKLMSELQKWYAQRIGKLHHMWRIKSILWNQSLWQNTTCARSM